MSVLEIITPEVFEPLLAEGKRYYAAHGGRGSGKSHFFAEKIVEECIIEPGTRVVCVREVQKSLKESAYRLICDKIEALGVSDQFRVLNDRIETPNGGLIIFQGMQDHTAESVKSLEGFRIAWVEEAQTMSSRSLEMLRPTIRAKGSQIWFSWNPRNASDPVDKFLRGENPPANAVVVQANYHNNPFFPSELEEERAHDRAHNPDRYAHIWLGEYEPMALGAIWNRQTIHEGRRNEAPDLTRVVVSVDPAVSNEENSDEHGIMVQALGEDQRGYLLEDASLKGSPRQWADRAVAMYDKHEADAIVIEVNQGGDMVRHTLETVRPGIKIVEVRATRGKHVRAEPISALYSTGRISHVGTFPDLEDQMCKMTAAGFEGEGSPDRVDAMVWGFTELFPSMTKKKVVRRTAKRSHGSSWMG